MKAEGGFTVIEVLVALALLGAGMLLFVRASLLALRMQEESRGIAVALVAAQEEMERIAARGWEVPAAECLSVERHGTISRCLKRREMKGREYRIVLERKVLDSSRELYSVACSLSGKGAARRQVRLVTLRRAAR